MHEAGHSYPCRLLLLPADGLMGGFMELHLKPISKAGIPAAISEGGSLSLPE